jgi:hypothetical protein
MALSDLELPIHRLSTKAFIDADPTVITLTPRQEQMVAGTKVFAPQPNRDPQTFKVIWTYDNGIYRQIGTPGGVHRFDFILLGEYDAVMAIGDFWKVGSQEFRIEYIFPSNGYEVKGGGISHGAEPG